MHKFIKILIILFGVAVVIFAGLYVYIFYAGGIEKFVVSKIDTSFGHKYNLDISIGEIEGDLLNGVILRNIIVTYKDTSRSVTLAEIPRLEAHYSLSGLLSGNYYFELVRIDSARFGLVAKEGGGWYLPSLAPGGYASRGTAPTLAGSIDDFQINASSFTLSKVDDTIYFTDIDLGAALETEDETFAADLKRFSLKSNRANLQLDHCSGKVTFSTGVFSFQDCSVGRGASRLKVNGRFDIKQFLGELNIAADNLDINEISRYAGLDLSGQIDLNGNFQVSRQGFEGSVDLAGRLQIAEFKNLHAELRFAEKNLYLDTIYGTILDQCAIDGKGQIDFSGETETYELRSSLTGFNLNSLIGGTFESDLNGDVYLRGKSFRTKQMNLEVDAAFYESIFNGYHLHAAVGSMQITSDAIVFFDPFIIEYFENVFGFSGRIVYKDNIDIKVAAQLKNLERYQGKLFIDKPAGRGFARAHLTGKTAQPDLQFHFESDSVWIYGLFSSKFTADADIDKFLTRKQGQIKINLTQGSAWDIPVDTGSGLLAVDSNMVLINSIELKSEYASVAAGGAFDYGAAPMMLNLDTLHLILFDQEFYNRGRLVVGVDSTGFDFQKTALGHKDVLINGVGQVGFDESLNMKFDLKNVIISPWMKFFEMEREYDGIVSGRAELLGLMGSPDFNLSLIVDSLVFRHVFLGNLATNVKYRDQLLSLDSLVLLSRQGRYSASGTVPIDLSFTATTVRRLLDNPMDLSISATDKRFDLVTTLLPSVEHLEGDFVADFKIYGTPNNPHIEGMAYLKNGQLKYFDLEQLIYTDSAAVVMKDNRIIIDNIEAYTYRDSKKKLHKRMAALEGEIIVKALDNLYYDVYVTLPREFPFTYELADIRGSIEGEMHIGGDTPPLVSGTLSLVAMTYGVNFASPDEGSPIMAAFSEQSSWDLNLNIDILSNYWIKNDDIDGQFTGFINMIRSDGSYSFIGEIEVIRGRGFFFDKTFTLEPGGTVTFEGGDSLNPRLDLTGYTRITSYNPLDSTSEQRNLGVHITGTLDYPEINPTEDSEVLGEDLLSEIAGSSYTTSTTSSFGTFEQRASGIVATQFSQIGSKQLRKLGVETFEVDPGFYEGSFDIAKTKFTVGFYSPFDPNLYVYGRSALGSSSGQELGFEYRLYKKFLLEGRRDEEELYHVNLKLHWEF